jgi:DNA replication protein DnaC
MKMDHLINAAVRAAKLGLHFDKAGKGPSTHDIGSEERTCTEHGPYKSDGRKYTLFNPPREIWTRCPACISRDQAAVDAHEAEQRMKRAMAQREELIKQSCLPARFVGRGFENFVASTDEQKRALTICRDYAEGFESESRKNGSSLVLSGKPGTGKSHLCAAVIQAVMSTACWAQYVTCMDMVRMIRGTWRKDSEQSEEDVLNQLGERIDLLVIDEIGMQYGTDGEQTIIFDVLDRRYRECKPSILLTNQDKAGFKDYVGERIFDRMTEVARWVPFDWSSYRPTARKAAQ